MTRVTIALIVLAACGHDTAKPIEELQDPNTCMECHQQHVTQWQASMHAYASDDPVFVAMNKRGQRETNGALGDFCIKCHAPMATQLGFTDYANFDPKLLPPAARGITCYFCHNVDQVTETHNNGLVLANDQTMRGGAKNPVTSPAHFSKYDALMDSDINQSEMCGSCHDIVVPEAINHVPGGVALERTFAEWQGTFFATEAGAQFHFTCGSCHMPSKKDLIADAPGLDVTARDNGFHEHLWPGIDQALTAFPGMPAQAAGITRDLDPALRVIGPFNSITKSQFGGICLDPPNQLKIRLDSIGTGHAWPSGAAQDRRAWLEVKVFDAAKNLLFSSGVTADNEDPKDTLGSMDVATVGLWDRMFKADNTPAHFFWEAARVQSQLMKIPAVRGEDHSLAITFSIADISIVDRIETRLLIRPLPFEVLDDLVATGDLDAGVAAQMKTLVVAGGASTWTRATKGMPPAQGTNCNPQ